MEQATAKTATIAAEALPGGARQTFVDPARGLSLPGVLVASLALHLGIGAALAVCPGASFAAAGLEQSWVSFEMEPLPLDVEPVPEPVVEPPPPAPEPEIVRARPQPREEVVPETPPEVVPEPIAPPSIDDVFAEEPAPPAPSLMAETAGAFATAAGEPGGLAGGTPGGHGTSLTSSVLHASVGSSPTGPSDADRRRARRSYVRSLEGLLRAHTRYPRAAARAGLEGRVELALRIGADGRLIATRVAVGSGHDLLDQAALDAAHELASVPPPPALAALTATDEVRVGVVYVVQ